MECWEYGALPARRQSLNGRNDDDDDDDDDDNNDECKCDKQNYGIDDV
jgi:hypothetical protein